MILSIKLEDLQLEFRVLDTPIAGLWVDRMLRRTAWPLDDPKRFYGFNTHQQDKQFALDKINRCIQQIRSQLPEITGQSITDVHDQDSLNYWHHVFETQHGLLGQEDRTHALTPVLAELNVAVHRCESVARGNHPRFVCTWYGMPKTKTLTPELMSQYGTLNPEFGTVCLNYAEIGKTLEDLAQDRDNYISDQAFKPFDHYSADFVVRMYEETTNVVDTRLANMRIYYQQHQDFFFEQGYTSFDDPRLLPLRFPVARLIGTHNQHQLCQLIAERQHITHITLQ